LAATFLSSDPVTVVNGTAANFICKSESNRAIDECKFQLPGFSEIKIFPGLKREKYEYIGQDLSKGECGIRILSANINNAGKVKCKLVIEDFSEQVAETNLVVLHPTEKIQFSSNNIYYEYKENDQIELTCTAVGGFPAPTMSLSIGMQFKIKNDHIDLICFCCIRWESSHEINIGTARAEVEWTSQSRIQPTESGVQG
jgi:hypothetical protein